MPPSQSAPPGSRPGFAVLVAGIALFVLIAIPLAAYLWETLNQLLAGQLVAPTRALLTLAVLVLLIALGRLLARVVERWDAGQRPGPGDRSVP